MSFPQAFIVEWQYLGRAMRGFVNAGFPHPFAFFCPHCGDLWARCPVETPAHTKVLWLSWSRPCRKCPPHSGEIPGSLILPWEPEFNSALPEEVLRWELNRHLDWLEKKVAQ